MNVLIWEEVVSLRQENVLVCRNYKRKDSGVLGHYISNLLAHGSRKFLSLSLKLFSMFEMILKSAIPCLLRRFHFLSALDMFAYPHPYSSPLLPSFPAEP